jgi:LysM repeat protein
VLVAGLVWAAAASAAAAPWTGRYTVRPGDSLTAIAKRYGVSLQSLADANRLDWRRPLLIGVVLHVPSAVSSTGPAAASWGGSYRVRPGDSLTAIAKRYGVSLDALATANRLDWQQPLLIGVVLHVPSTGPSAGALTHATSTGPAATRWAGSYVVRPGDTLSAIASRYRVSIAQLASANGIDPAGLLLAGVRLRIPTGTASTADLAHTAQSNPYRHGAVGYDVSYPNCDAPIPAAHEFAVIGLNAGRPFTANPCFAREWAAAQPPRSVYVNTAYSETLLRHVTPDCSAAGRSQPLGGAAQSAYAIGCDEAAFDLQLLAATPPLAVWLDVEPDNTWSTRPDLNAATIKGMLDRLLAQTSHPVIGLYSNQSFWRQIVGGWTSVSLPEWVATGAPDPPGCPAGFAAGPVWLSQSVAAGLDVDTAC